MNWDNPPLIITTLVDFTNFLVWLVYFGIIWWLLIKLWKWYKKP